MAGFTCFGRRDRRVDFLEDVVEGSSAEVVGSAALPVPALVLTSGCGGTAGLVGFAGLLGLLVRGHGL